MKEFDEYIKDEEEKLLGTRPNDYDLLSINEAYNYFESYKKQLNLFDVSSSKTNKNNFKFYYENKYLLIYYKSKISLIIDIIIIVFFITGFSLMVTSFN